MVLKAALRFFTSYFLTMTSQHIKRIVFAEDQEIFRNGFLRILENIPAKDFEIVAVARNGVELLDKVKEHQPEIVITDIKMPEMDGIQACRLIKMVYPTTRIIAFSIFDHEHYVVDMLHAGASGYLVKSATIDEVLEAIRTVGNGQPYYCSSFSGKLYGVYENSNLKKRRSHEIEFSTQELNIIRLLGLQMTSKEIAAQLQISHRTVEDHRQKIQEKTGARNAVGIILYALVNGIIDVREE